MNIFNNKKMTDYLSEADLIRKQFHDAPPAVMKLVEGIDALILEVFSRESDASADVTFLMINAYTSLLAAINLTTCGSTNSVFPVLRAALESSCYAFLISEDESLAETWRNRDRDDSAKKNVGVSSHQQ